MVHISASEPHQSVLSGEVGTASRERVVVIGLTALGYAYAKFLRLWGGGNLDVALVGSARQPAEPEPDSALTGDLAAECRHHGIRLYSAAVASIDARIHLVSLRDGSHLPYDRLVIAPDEPSATRR